MRVLDQFEIESTSTYESGSYDQHVSGKMFSSKKIFGVGYVYFAGNRGVVFGSVNASQAKQPGDGPFDASASTSYRLQPHSEKAGNCRAAKHVCYSERYYDSLPPDFWACTKINGGNIFYSDGWEESPGYGDGYNGMDREKMGFIMFDNFLDSPAPVDRRNLNSGVDRHWMKSFPYEPRYSATKRQKDFSFLRNTYATFELNFLDSNFLTNKFGPFTPKKVKGVYFGFVGPQKIGSYYHERENIGLGQNWKHYWVSDIFTYKNSGGYAVTSSAPPNDVVKFLYGFGDVTTTFYTGSYGDNRLGSSNIPDFRAKFPTENVQVSPNNYELVTGSIWCASPVIRGWKYGLHSAFPSYTSAYFRQGKYGQFRDMLEQRQYTKLFVEGSEKSVNINGIKSSNITSIGSPAVTVRFLDQNGNITDPENTQSSNLSNAATSSLPYFDLQFRNVSIGKKITNLKLVNFNISGDSVEI